jgi:hypothetical protein
VNEQGVPSVVAQSIFVKFITSEKAKPAEVLIRLRVHFRDETLSMTQVYNFKAGQSLKT